MTVPTALTLSVLSLSAVSLISFFTVYTIFKNQNRSPEDISFANCWMVVGFTFALISLRTAFFGLNLPELDQALAYVVQISLIFIFIFMGHYIIYISIENKAFKLLLYSLLLISSVSFLLFILNSGIQGPMVSEWGTEYTAPPEANLILTWGGLVSLLLLIYHLARKSKTYFKTKNYKKILAPLSLVLFLAFGIFEQLGGTGWQVIIFRILILISVLVAYSSYEVERYKA